MYALSCPVLSCPAPRVLFHCVLLIPLIHRNDFSTLHCIIFSAVRLPFCFLERSESERRRTLCAGRQFTHTVQIYTNSTAGTFLCATYALSHLEFLLPLFATFIAVFWKTKIGVFLLIEDQSQIYTFIANIYKFI